MSDTDEKIVNKLENCTKAPRKKSNRKDAVKREEETTAKTPRSSKRKAMLYSLLGMLGLGLLLAGRMIYVILNDPMQAFRTQQPAYSAVTMTPAPSVPSATPGTPATTTPKETQSGAGIGTPAVAPVPSPSPTPKEEYTQSMDFMENRVNILLVGYDKSPEREDEENVLYRDASNDFRSDVLMVLTVDFKNKSVYLISIPRDSYAPIYNDKGELYSKRGRWKINAAFAKGGSGTTRGYQFAMQTAGRLLGVPVEYYAGVDMDGLKGVVNAMGGVYYDVDIEIRLNGRTLSKGYQLLNGQQVMDYCRARKGISTDVGRTDKQQRILFAIFEQLQSRDQLKNFPDIYRHMKRYIETNMNLEQIASIAAFGARLDMKDISRYTLEGEYSSNTPYSSANYYLIDNLRLRQKMHEIFRIQIRTNPRYDLYYVLGDIAAKQAKQDIASVEYLLSHSIVQNAFSKNAAGEYVSHSAALVALSAQVDYLKFISTRAEGADMDIPLDEKEIRNTQSRLYALMQAVCLELKITQKDVIASRLPKEVYNALPKTPQAQSLNGDTDTSH